MRIPYAAVDWPPRSVGVRHGQLAVQPLHVSAWIEQQTQEHAAPTAKLRLAPLRHLFDWLVTGQVMPANPAGSVRGPSHVVKSGRLAGPGADRIDGWPTLTGMRNQPESTPGLGAGLPTQGNERTARRV
jgi:hypothetical protein